MASESSAIATGTAPLMGDLLGCEDLVLLWKALMSLPEKERVGYGGCYGMFRAIRRGASGELTALLYDNHAVGRAKAYQGRVLTAARTVWPGTPSVAFEVGPEWEATAQTTPGEEWFKGPDPQQKLPLPPPPPLAQRVTRPPIDLRALSLRGELWYPRPTSFDSLALWPDNIKLPWTRCESW